MTSKLFEKKQKRRFFTPRVSPAEQDLIELDHKLAEVESRLVQEQPRLLLLHPAK